MSTRSKRGNTATPQPQSEPGSASTPLTPSGVTSANSPQSPTRYSRIQEKVELQNLNDRLACYIDRVRNLETENARLNAIITTKEETEIREATKKKSMYESELNETRRLLDDTAREKAKLEMDVSRLWEENKDLVAKIEKKSKDLSNAETNARMFETRANDLSLKYNASNNERKKAVDDLNEALRELDSLRKQFEMARKSLEEETLSRIDLENTILSLREELSFKEQIHSQELTETLSRRQTEISEIDGRLSEQYEAKLQQSLQELRNQYEDQLRCNRDEIEKLYDNKIKNLQSAVNHHANTATGSLEELRTARTRIDGFNVRINELQNINVELNTRIRELEQLLDQERARHSADVANFNAELQQLRDEMDAKVQEYRDLLDIKVSLDLELAAYDKLLCGEESRLNITPSTHNTASQINSFCQSLRTCRKTPTDMRSSPSPRRKYPKLFESESLSQSEYFVTSNAKGDVQILEIDPDGKYVKLHNKGAKEISIGGWQLRRFVNDKKTEETTFKFHRSVKIDPDGTVTVWSSDIDVTHEPPNNIVMKQQKWITGDVTKTLLYNSEGEEVAGYERIKRTTIKQTVHHRSSRGTSRRLGVSGRQSVSVVGGNEHLYHQEADPQHPGDEKCSIM